MRPYSKEDLAWILNMVNGDYDPVEMFDVIRRSPKIKINSLSKSLQETNLTKLRIFLYKMRKHGLIEISKNNVPEDWGNDFISARQDLQNLITRYKREYLRELKEKISEIGKLA